MLCCVMLRCIAYIRIARPASFVVCVSHILSEGYDIFSDMAHYALILLVANFFAGLCSYLTKVRLVQ